MLEANGVRPSDATTIYYADVNIPVLVEQIKEFDADLKTAIENGDITVSVREPTQNLLAALIIDATSFSKRLDRAMVTMKTLASGFGRGLKDVEVDLGNGKVGINIEEHTTSAFKKTISVDVANLPA